MLPIDGAPGGLYNINVMMQLSGSMSKYVLQPQFCFVPTVSALALTNWKDKLTVNLQNENFYASGTSKFEQYFTSPTNDLHTRLNASASFLYNQLYPFNQDVYIQNETITNNRYIAGKNIYVGSAVTATKPQGNVLITNKAHVIFDATGNITFSAGFDCALGATFEVIKH